MLWFCICFCLLATPAWPSYSQTIPSTQTEIPNYQCLGTGLGHITAPYDQPFHYQLLLGDGYLHFVFDFPIDPAQCSEIDTLEAQKHLGWQVGWFEVNGKYWTAVVVPVETEVQDLILALLDQLLYMVPPNQTLRDICRQSGQQRYQQLAQEFLTQLRDLSFISDLQ